MHTYNVTKTGISVYGGMVKVCTNKLKALYVYIKLPYYQRVSAPFDAAFLCVCGSLCSLPESWSLPFAAKDSENDEKKKERDSYLCKNWEGKLA